MSGFPKPDTLQHRIVANIPPPMRNFNAFNYRYLECALKWWYAYN